MGREPWPLGAWGIRQSGRSEVSAFPALNSSFLIFKRKSTRSPNDLPTTRQDALGRKMPTCPPHAGPSVGGICAYCRQVQWGDTNCLEPGQLGEPVMILMFNDK